MGGVMRRKTVETVQGGTKNFIRADGCWRIRSGGGSASCRSHLEKF
jgi:hypothetical protein